jgi:hypothetical protein
MALFPWQIDQFRLPVFSTLSHRLHTNPLPVTHAVVGTSQTDRMAFCNLSYDFLSLIRQIEWVSRMINSSHMSSLEPPCPGATRRGVAPTPIRGWGSSQCRGLGAAAPIRLYDGNQIYPLKTAKSQFFLRLTGYQDQSYPARFPGTVATRFPWLQAIDYPDCDQTFRFHHETI